MCMFYTFYRWNWRHQWTTTVTSLFCV